MEDKELTTQEVISPSSINCYFKCPRQYYYRYIAKLPIKQSIHLVKGTLVHKTLEDFFGKKYDKRFSFIMSKYFLKAWAKNKKALANLELSEEELLVHKKDCINMLRAYLSKFNATINDLIDIGKAENKRHAYYLIKPKFKEQKVASEEYHCRGYIDRVDITYDDKLVLGDYKTSVKYGIGLSEDYIRQMYIYAFLYNEQEKKLADYVDVVFLRYGENTLMPVTMDTIEQAKKIVVDTYENTRSVDIKDYPKKENKLCGWCNYEDLCSGKAEREQKERLKKYRELLKK